MNGSRGVMSLHRLFGASEMKISDTAHVDLVIREFLKIGEAIATRWIQMPRGVLLLQMAPENPASGAIYVYDRERQQFYLVCFEGPDDNLTLPEFQDLVREYGLLRLAEHPALLQNVATA